MVSCDKIDLKDKVRCARPDGRRNRKQKSAMTMAPSGDEAFGKALASLQAGNLNDAEKRFKEVLRRQPMHIGALNILSVVLTRLEKYHEAEKYIQSALKLNSNSDATFYNYGLILKALKRPNEALTKFSQAISLNAGVAETWNSRGTIFNDLKRHVDAAADFDKAIALQPNYPEAFYNKGQSLKALKRREEAIAAYDRALALKPDLIGALLGRGNVCVDLKRYDDAVIAFDKALSFKADFAEAWLGRGNAFSRLKRYDEALRDYNRALALNFRLAEAWLGQGNVFAALKSYNEAFAAFDKALTLDPELAEAWLGQGNIFGARKRYDDAFAAYDKALSLKPDLPEAWLCRGNVLNELKRYDEAFAAFDKAFAVDPDVIDAEGSRLHAKMRLCNWSNFDAECRNLIASVRNGNANTQPFPFFSIPSSAEDQLRCARLWVAKTAPAAAKPVWQGERYNHDRIRLAYISADFRIHPVSQLAVGMFERHDKSRFDVAAISIGPDDNSELRKRLKSSFERFIDAETYSDEQLAQLIKESEIDILVDLMGFTGNSRTNVLARRCAPIQVNYLGYAGTMGADFIDYLISDRIVVPPPHEKNFAEKIVHLPNSFMPHDEVGRAISSRHFERVEFGLPQTGFVFCCFNNSYKFNPHSFDSWARILKAVEASVLWLSTPGPTAVAKLRTEMSARGLNPDRLVFADPISSMAEHLARVRLADLFLDTLPYNAHTTASDALWAGLPVLTCIGETFAGRVAASLLNAIGLPELVTTTTGAYEQMAIDLATHPEKLAALKNKLAQNRLTTPLFDTKLFTRHIEAAYSAMHERHQAGLPPDHIVIPN